MGAQSSKTEDTMEFSSEPRASEVSELISTLVKDGVPSVHYSKYADVRKVAKHPHGFEEEDVKMAKRDKNQLDIRNFLAPSPQNLERDFQLDAGFMSKDRGGHAVVVLRDYDLSSSRVLSPFLSDVTETHDITLPPEDNLRLLHLRFSRDEVVDGQPVLQLGLDTRTKTTEFYRHVGLLRIRTTERLLRHTALRSCPPRHRNLVEDCATFARNFFVNLLHHLKDCGVIDEAGLSEQIRTVVRHIHITDGSAGESEHSARDNPALAETVHASMVVATQPKEEPGKRAQGR